MLDLTEEFYLETFDRIFQRADLANGSFTCHGRKVDPGVIRHTALLTVEGGRATFAPSARPPSPTTSAPPSART